MDWVFDDKLDAIIDSFIFFLVLEESPTMKSILQKKPVFIELKILQYFRRIKVSRITRLQKISITSFNTL